MVARASHPVWPKDGDHWTLDEFLRNTRLSRATVYNYVANGLETYKRGRAVMISGRAWREYLSKLEQEQRADSAQAIAK